MKITNFSARSHLFSLTLGLAAGLISCEKPELAGKGEETMPPSAPASTPPSTPEANLPANAVPPVVVENEVPSPPDFPKLVVFREGDTIVIGGALKSRLQKARIAEELARDFPDLKIDDQLVVENHRYPVGWGNRVSLAFVVPYFKQIKNPYVECKEGIVILKGECSKEGDIRYFQELAISVFAGMHLRDIKNEMKVSGN